MPDNIQDAQKILQQQAATLQTITHLFSPEDAGLQYALDAGRTGGLPPIQISPLQGKLLQALAMLCQAHKILEIGSLAGYSGIWLARALPSDGRLISLEISPKHAEVIRDSFAHAGVSDKAEVRVGNALELLPTLKSETPFDLIFIDADKNNYPVYLDWALQLTHPGSVIVADNTIRSGERLRDPLQIQDKNDAAVAMYNQRVLNNPRLLSLALAIDDNYTDGFTISIVRPDGAKDNA